MKNPKDVIDALKRAGLTDLGVKADRHLLQHEITGARIGIYVGGGKKKGNIKGEVGDALDGFMRFILKQTQRQ